jgi:hypothetical protein
MVVKDAIVASTSDGSSSVLNFLFVRDRVRQTYAKIVECVVLNGIVKRKSALPIQMMDGSRTPNPNDTIHSGLDRFYEVELAAGRWMHTHKLVYRTSVIRKPNAFEVTFISDHMNVVSEPDSRTAWKKFIDHIRSWFTSNSNIPVQMIPISEDDNVSGSNSQERLENVMDAELTDEISENNSMLHYQVATPYMGRYSEDFVYSGETGSIDMDM